MSRKSTAGSKRSGEQSVSRSRKRPDQEASEDAPAILARTSVYRQVPPAVRARMDRAILFRPEDCSTFEAIDQRFKLGEKYGITPAALRTYANRLEQLVRPMVTAQVVAGVLGCLPESHRQQVLAGSQVMLISRVADLLHGDKENALPIADLAKLASILKSVAGQTQAKCSRAGCSRRQASESADPAAATTLAEPAKMAEAVRMIYGLDWPMVPEEQKGTTDEHR